jgi:hypothetical protein
VVGVGDVRMRLVRVVGMWHVRMRLMRVVRVVRMRLVWVVLMRVVGMRVERVVSVGAVAVGGVRMLVVSVGAVAVGAVSVGSVSVGVVKVAAAGSAASVVYRAGQPSPVLECEGGGSGGRGGGGGDVDEGGSISGDDRIRCEPGVDGELATAGIHRRAVEGSAPNNQFPPLVGFVILDVMRGSDVMCGPVRIICRGDCPTGTRQGGDLVLAVHDCWAAADKYQEGAERNSAAK